MNGERKNSSKLHYIRYTNHAPLPDPEIESQHSDITSRTGVMNCDLTCQNGNLTGFHGNRMGFQYDIMGSDLHEMTYTTDNIYI